MVVQLGDLNVSARRVLTFRAAQALSLVSPPADARNPAGTFKNFRVMLRDNASRSATVSIAGFGQALSYPYVRNDEPAPLVGGITKPTAELSTKSGFLSVRVPMWAFHKVAPKLDLTHLTEFRLLLDGTGLMVVDDIAFSA